MCPWTEEFSGCKLECINGLIRGQKRLDEWFNSGDVL